MSRHFSRPIACVALLLLAGCGSDRFSTSKFPPLAWFSTGSHVAAQAPDAPPELRPSSDAAAVAAVLTASDPVATRPDAAGQVDPLPPTNPNPENYLIGPGDDLNIFVWRNPDLSTRIPVRPDGKISIPLVEDVVATGKTPTTLAREIEDKLRTFVKDPIVTVVVSQFVGPFGQQVRVIGEAAQPRALPFRTNLTLLDVMIEVGGLTRFAAGDRSVIVRKVEGQSQTVKVHLDELIKDGDVKENQAMRPGDILIIPQRYF